MKKQKILFVLAIGLFFAGLTIIASPKVAAAATIIVDSTDDDIADDGVCTLREAITSANADSAPGADPNECEDGSGTDTINFAIAGTGVHTITLLSVLPAITETVIINGYSESDASVNDAISPLPFNGTLIIQIDGSGLGAGDDALSFTGGAAGSVGSEIRGLVISNFPGDAILLDADNITIQGNYIGTNPGGTAAAGNRVGINHSGSSASNVLVGGTDPEDRNIISGHTDAASYPLDNWTIQGNYVGLAKNGTSAIPNSSVTNPGAFSIDNCDGVTVGGTTIGSMNVISGNSSYGIAPDNATNLTIQGNLIGTDYTGTTAVPNSYGIIIGGDATGQIIGGTSSSARNIISGNTFSGIASGTTGGLAIQGNYIGLDITGGTPLGNGLSGVQLGGQDEVVGGSEAARNIISGNAVSNVYFQGYNGVFVVASISGSVVAGNYIGTAASGDLDAAISAAQGTGVLVSADVDGIIIGGDSLGESNRIAGNSGYGVGVRRYIAGGVFDWTAKNVTIIGNNIYDNIATDLKTTDGTATTVVGAEASLGIDLYTVTDIGPDFVEDTFAELGFTVNDATDSDDGPNSYMNAPVINSASQDGTALSVDLDLDANDADTSDNTYRVEFFANDAADASGYGEGQTYLGFATIANGNSQDVNVTVPNGTDLTGKVLSATTTAINTATASNFGATSEFSLASSDITVVAAATTNNNGSTQNGNNAGNNLEKTGDDMRAILALGTFIASAGGAILYAKRRYKYSILR